MSYNLLIDTQFKINHWKFINCTYEDGILTSNRKVFGIEQELILPNPTKLYFRINYIVGNISIKDVKIGIQCGDTLHINRKYPKLRKPQYISVINDVEQEKIKLHVIFESDLDINTVQIENPILCDLNYLGKSTWLKWILDKTIKFRNGYIYSNLYETTEILPSTQDFKDVDLIPAKVGSIIQTKENIKVKLNAKFIINHYYLIKLDYEEINKLGETFFNYNVIKSFDIDNKQCYIIFKANGDSPYLNIQGNDVLDYQVNLKHLMIIDITNMRLLREDIPYLPFV